MVENSIADVIFRPLAWEQDRLTILRSDDHLLRRFGQIQLVEVAAGTGLEFWREQADEIWTVFSGAASLLLRDGRDQSPTRGSQMEFNLSESDPLAVLIPFGVACRIESASGAVLLRTSTHEDGSFSSDRT